MRPACHQARAALVETSDWSLSIGTPATLFLAGAAYSLVPMIFCASVLCTRSRCGDLAYTILPSAMFLALLAPGILLECARFSVGAVAGLALGSAVGALLGNLAGARVGPAILAPRGEGT